jgi:spore germination protein GerM
MQHESIPPSTRQRIVFWIAAGALITGGVIGWWTWRSPIDGQSNLPASDVSSIPAEPYPQAYWIRSQDNQLELIPSAVEVPPDLDAAESLIAGFEQLLIGQPTQANQSSAIPPGTMLRSLTIEADGIHIDLSSEFLEGGGSASMQGRLGQVIYTASCLDPTAAVWISIGGKPLEFLGGEGLEVTQPMTREQFNQNFSL